MVEMAFRAYDPCFSCATHSLPGEMPLQIVFQNRKGEVIGTMTRNDDGSIATSDNFSLSI